MSDYSEHVKMAAVREQSQAIGEFIDTSGYALCIVVDGEYRAVNGMSIEAILADYFKIDLEKIEAEKRAMLAKIRGEAA